MDSDVFCFFPLSLQVAFKNLYLRYPKWKLLLQRTVSHHKTESEN